MERIINHKVSMPSKDVVDEKSEKINLDLSNNNSKICIKNKQMEELSTVKSSQDKEIRDGYYFLRLLYSEKSRILKMADEMDKELEVLQSDVRFIFPFFL